jgi:hypothetical protein
VKKLSLLSAFALFIVTLTFPQSAQAASPSITTGEAQGFAGNCLIEVPIVSIADNCIVLGLDSNSDWINNGGFSITLPAGISISKSLTLATYDFGCAWNGKFTTSKNMKNGKLTVTVTGVYCDPGAFLGIAFSAKIAAPFTGAYGGYDNPYYLNGTYWYSQSAKIQNFNNSGNIPLSVWPSLDLGWFI